MFKFLAVSLLLAACFSPQVSGLPSESASTTTPTSDVIKPEIVPFSAVGNVAGVQSPNSNTRLYYQDSTGAIFEYSLSGPFNSGNSDDDGVRLIVPADEALFGTSISAITFGDNLQIIHVYFLSPSNVLSEYFWTNSNGWNGGASCAQCLTASGFLAVGGSKILYSMGNADTSGIRVGFLSAGAPSTLSEADSNSGNGQWQLAQLPNLD